jgi:hypothetical protein
MTNGILAKAFSCADATEQAQMLNTMARELYVACKGRMGFETQCCYITDELTSDGMAFVEMLAGFVKLRREEMPRCS